MRTAISWGVVAWAMAWGLVVGCGPQPHTPRHSGTYRPNPDWAHASQRPLQTKQTGPHRVGEVTILEGDATTVSGIQDSWGLVFDENRNDPGAVTELFATEVADTPRTLILFTAFDDRGSGGPAYFIPLFNDTEGTGLGPVDQRDDFGVSQLHGFVNMKWIDNHTRLLPTLMHEIAHRHVAYMRAQTVTSTRVLDLTGRQGGHWHAALHTQASLLEGYSWQESGPGRFIIVESQTRFSGLDLYALGFVEADEVRPFFFIDDARTLSGALIPPAAQLPLNTVVQGTRVDITIEDVIREIGPRSPRDAVEHVVFAVLTAPGQAATSSSAIQLAQRVDALRLQAEVRWNELTDRRSTLFTQIERPSSTADAGMGPVTDDPGCDCSNVEGWGASPGLTLLGVLGLLAWRGRRFRKR